MGRPADEPGLPLLLPGRCILPQLTSCTAKHRDTRLQTPVKQRDIDFKIPLRFTEEQCFASTLADLREPGRPFSSPCKEKGARKSSKQ